jgi:putative transposase
MISDGAGSLVIYPNILQKGLSTAGHAGNYAWGDLPSWEIGAILSSNGGSENQESLRL